MREFKELKQLGFTRFTQYETELLLNVSPDVYLSTRDFVFKNSLEPKHLESTYHYKLISSKEFGELEFELYCLFVNKSTSNVRRRLLKGLKMLDWFSLSFFLPVSEQFHHSLTNRDLWNHFVVFTVFSHLTAFFVYTRFSQFLTQNYNATPKQVSELVTTDKWIDRDSYTTFIRNSFIVYLDLSFSNPKPNQGLSVLSSYNPSNFLDLLVSLNSVFEEFDKVTRKTIFDFTKGKGKVILILDKNLPFSVATPPNSLPTQPFRLVSGFKSQFICHPKLSWLSYESIFSDQSSNHLFKSSTLTTEGLELAKVILNRPLVIDVVKLKELVYKTSRIFFGIPIKADLNRLLLAKIAKGKTLKLDYSAESYYYKRFQYANTRLQNIIPLDQFLQENLKSKSNLNKVWHRYIPHSYDFRGRMYYKGLVSPTKSKLIRYCLLFPTQSGISSKELSKVVTDFKLELDFISTEFSIAKTDLTKLTNLLGLLLILGKLQPTVKDSLYVSYLDVIKHAVNRYKYFCVKKVALSIKTFKKFTDVLYEKHLLTLIDQTILKSLNSEYRGAIELDFSASVLLISSLRYGLDKNVQTNFNASQSDGLYDPYLALYTEYLRSQSNWTQVNKNYSEQYKSEISKFYTRSVLKKPIMLSGYGGTWYNVSRELRKILKKHQTTHGVTLGPAQKFAIMLHGKELFTNFLKVGSYYTVSDSRYEYYKLYHSCISDPQPLMDYENFNSNKKESFKGLSLDENNYIKSLDPLASYQSQFIKVNYLYVQPETQTFWFKGTQKRVMLRSISPDFTESINTVCNIYQTQHLTNMLDFSKTKSSFLPNYIHNWDSTCIKIMLSELDGSLGIHDCVIVAADQFWLTQLSASKALKLVKSSDSNLEIKNPILLW